MSTTAIPLHGGIALKEARLRAGLTQIELAAAAGISQSYLSQVERGDRAMTDKVAARCERVLALEVDELAQYVPGRPAATVRPRRRTRRKPGLHVRLTTGLVRPVLSRAA